MAKITAKLTLSNRELAILKKALEAYKITASEFENKTVIDLIELVDNLKDKIKLNQKKERIFGKFSKVR